MVLKLMATIAIFMMGLLFAVCTLPGYRGPKAVNWKRAAGYTAVALLAAAAAGYTVYLIWTGAFDNPPARP